MAALQISSAVLAERAACGLSPLKRHSLKSSLRTGLDSTLRGAALPARHQSLSVQPGSAARGPLRCNAAVVVKESYGVAEAQGVGRPSMEDRFTVATDGAGPSFFAVYDGHGGDAVAKLLSTEFWPVYKKKLAELAGNLEQATNMAYAEVDQLTLAAPKGLFGALMERGVGGSKCGACANTLVVLPDGTLVAANVGDARTVLGRAGKAVQLSVDHKPDVEEERLRIEAKNPFPKQPLVKRAGGEWRVGGLLALSRAFGDVYLKNWDDGQRNGTSGGYGLTAEPSVAIEKLTPEDSWVVLGTDGLWDHVPNQEAIDLCLQEGAQLSPTEIAGKLLKLAVSRGSTDDITVIVLRLPLSA